MEIRATRNLEPAAKVPGLEAALDIELSETPFERWLRIADALVANAPICHPQPKTRHTA